MFNVDIVYTRGISEFISEDNILVSEEDLNDIMKVFNKNYTRMYTIEDSDSVIIGFQKENNKCSVKIYRK